MTSKHTPTPWSYKATDEGFDINSGSGNPVAYVGSSPVDKANAAFIVEAVNSHDTLLRQRDELRLVLKRAEQYLEDIQCAPELLKDIGKAIANSATIAKEKQP